MMVDRYRLYYANENATLADNGEWVGYDDYEKLLNLILDKALENKKLTAENQRLRAALEGMLQRLNESGTGEMGLVDTIHDVHVLAQAALKQWEGECEHGKGLNDYCEPCGRIHNET